MKMNLVDSQFECHFDSLLFRAVILLRIPVTLASTVPRLTVFQYRFLCNLIPGLGELVTQLENSGLDVCICRYPVTKTSSVRLTFLAENRFIIEPSEGETYSLPFVKQK